MDKATPIILRSDSVSLTILPLELQPDDVGAISCRVDFEATGIGVIHSSASIAIDNLNRFAHEVDQLRTTLSGKVSLYSVEEDFECLIDCVAGKVEIISIVPLPCDLGRLHLRFDTDQSFL
ncbi:MAG: hypothetical protein JNM85_09145 [Chthonomonas sp.]|nr:hypothetical protein [Chthonomonas sp.]